MAQKDGTYLRLRSARSVPCRALVGYLIAEWRRRTWGEPVAYVVPTGQLAQQAAGLGRLYGIPAVDWSAKSSLA